MWPCTVIQVAELTVVPVKEQLHGALRNRLRLTAICNMGSNPDELPAVAKVLMTLALQTSVMLLFAREYMLAIGILVGWKASSIHLFLLANVSFCCQLKSFCGKVVQQSR